jgi:spore maturation protein CgeB
MSDDSEVKSLIRKNLLGDIYFHVVEQGDERMRGFKEYSSRDYLTIPLAVDKTILSRAKYSERFDADISFIGTNLPQKRKYFNEWVFPLKEQYKLKLYGQDWTLIDRRIGDIQKLGQYFNIPYLKSIRKPKLSLEDEFCIYASSRVCVNIHEDYQRKFGGDCNERTFKIPSTSCLEIVDDVSCISKYYRPDKEIVIASSRDEWFDKIYYYIHNNEAARKIAKAGLKRTLTDHTYHNRALNFLV